MCREIALIDMAVHSQPFSGTSLRAGHFRFCHIADLLLARERYFRTEEWCRKITADKF